MKKLPLLTVLLLATCVRSQVSPPSRPQYDESIKFPKDWRSGGTLLGGAHEKLIIDGAIVQATMIAAQDFIPPRSGGYDCFTKPGDFYYDVIRDGDIIFVRISPNYLAEGCELKPAPLDWSTKYAISTDGRILRRAPSDEPDEPGETPSPSSPDAGENGDGGSRRLYDLKDLVPMISGPVDDPPFFTRPEWRAQHPWPPSRNRSSPDGGTPNGDGGTPDGGFHADGGSPALPSK